MSQAQLKFDPAKGFDCYKPSSFRFSPSNYPKRYGGNCLTTNRVSQEGEQMKKKLKLFFIISILLFSIAGCGGLADQLIVHTYYRICDMKIEGKNLMVLFEKDRTKMKVSMMAAIMGESSKIAWERHTYSLLFFDKNELFNKPSIELSYKKKKNIVVDKDVWGQLKIIDRNRILSDHDIINDQNFISIIDINNLSVKHVSSRLGDIRGFGSFDGEKYFYIFQNRIFIFDSTSNRTTELINGEYGKSFAKQFQYAIHISNNDEMIFCLNVFDDSGCDKTEGENAFYYRYVVKDWMANNIGGFCSRFVSIQDIDKNRHYMLMSGPHLGLSITDMHGKVLYSLYDKSLSIERAVIDGDKVYACEIPSASINSTEIEFLEWDFKNKKTIRKEYPL
jgi:hypothetical protein